MTVLLLISVLFTIYRLITAPSSAEEALPGQKVKIDYLLPLVQCILGLLVIRLPHWLGARLNLRISNAMLIMYIVFLYAAIYLGEVRDFYYRVPQWDSFLHCFSGMMMGALSFSCVTLLNDAQRIPMNLSPVFVALFAFSFAMTLGVIWEFYEYTVDGLMGLNMQKFRLEDGTVLMGHAALRDTMKDLFIDGCGALVTAMLGFISLKYKKGWIERLLVHKR